jgi:hypothetical protein
MEYLSILAGHGVPFLYFPELQGNDSPLPVPNDKFFKMLNNVMFKETTEVVLIPSEITYTSRMDETEKKDMFTEPVGINFSSPVFLSEYTRQSSSDIPISELIHKIWILDEIILPHYIICGILFENDFTIKVSKLKKMIYTYIADNRIIINKSDKAIMTEGLKVLQKNSIIVRKDDFYIGLKQDVIKKFADFIKIKETVKIDNAD